MKPPPDSRTSVLVIAGWDRSGSTVLADVLGAAPGACSVGEVNNLWQRGMAGDRSCSCGRHFSECEFWSAVATEAFGDEPIVAVGNRVQEAYASLGSGWLVSAQLPGSGAGAKAAPYAAALTRLYRGIAAVAGCNLIVDASKVPWHAYVAAGLKEFDVTVVHIVRNPRGVVSSHRKRVRYDPDSEDPHYMDRHGTVFTTLGWAFRTRQVERLWRGTPNYVSIRYEDFVADPHGAAQSLLAAAGHHGELPFTDDNTIELPQTHNISGNPSRFRSGPTSIRLDDAWKADLPASTSRMVSILGWPLLKRYGYSR